MVKLSAMLKIATIKGRGSEKNIHHISVEAIFYYFHFLPPFISLITLLFNLLFPVVTLINNCWLIHLS